MALSGIAMLCGFFLTNYQKDFVRINQHSKGRLDKFIMCMLWFILFIIFAIPWTISRMCYMRLEDIVYISGWFVGPVLIIAAVLDAVLLVLCRHYYYRK